SRENKNGCENENDYPTLRLRVAFVGGFKFLDERLEKPGVLRVTRGGVVMNEVAATAAQDFAHGSGGQIGNLGRDRARFDHGKHLFGGAKGALFNRIDEERGVLEIAAHHEVSGQA